MTLARRLLILVVLSFAIPYFAGFGVVVSMISMVTIAVIAKAILSARGGITGETEIDFGGHPPAAHHGHHGHDEHREGRGEHDVESSHGEHHEAHGDHSVEEEPPKRAVVKAPIWKVEPRWFFLLPFALLSLAIVEAGLYWLVAKELRMEWSSDWAMIPPAVLGLVAVHSKGFVRTFNGKVIIRFLGRFLIMDNRPGETRFFFFARFFKVEEIPILYPTERKEITSEAFTMPDAQASGAEFVVKFSPQVTPGDEPVDLLKIAMFGGMEAVYQLAVNSVKVSFAKLAADPRKPPYTVKEALDRRSFALFQAAGSRTDVKWLGLKPVSVENLSTDAAPSTKRAMESRFIANETAAAQRTAIRIAGSLIKELKGQGVDPKTAERLVLSNMGWANVILDGGGGGTDEKIWRMDTLEVAGSNSKKRRRSGGEGGDE